MSLTVAVGVIFAVVTIVLIGSLIIIQSCINDAASASRERLAREACKLKNRDVAIEKKIKGLEEYLKIEYKETPDKAKEYPKYVRKSK